MYNCSGILKTPAATAANDEVRPVAPYAVPTLKLKFAVLSPGFRSSITRCVISILFCKDIFPHSIFILFLNLAWCESRYHLSRITHHLNNFNNPWHIRQCRLSHFSIIWHASCNAFSTIVIAQMSYVRSFGSSGKYLIPLLSPEWSFTLLAQFWSYVLHIFTSCKDHYRIKSCSTFFSPVFTDATNLYPITVHFQFRITFWTFFQYIHSHTPLC